MTATINADDHENARRRLIRRMRRGRCLVRDEIGGAVGTVYRWADRGGEPGVSPAVVERLLRLGCKVAGARHRLVTVPGPATPTYALLSESEGAA